MLRSKHLDVEYDQYRESEMLNLGLNILRIKNEELQDISEVLTKIETYLRSVK
jgi:very-short-patch-repair endonuclease